MKTKTRNRRDLIGGFLFLLTGVGVLFESLRLKVGTPTTPKAGFFPFVSGIILIALSLMVMVHGWLKPDKETAGFGDIRRPAILVAGTAIYVLILDPLGYVLSTFFLGAVILWVLGIRSWRILGGASAALSVGTYILFARILGIELPMGVLEFIG